MTTIIIDKYDTSSGSNGSPDIYVSMDKFINGKLDRDMINKIVENSYRNQYSFLDLTDQKKIQQHITEQIDNVERALEKPAPSAEGGSKIHKKLGYKYKTKRKRKILRRRSRRKVFGSI